LGHSPRTILEELGRIQRTDVILPTVEGRDLRLRCVVRREPAPAHLLARLGLDLPEQPCICPPTLLATEMYCRLFRHVCEDGSDLWQLRKLG